MIDSMFLDTLRAAIGTRHDLIGADDAQGASLRAMFETRLIFDATPCLPGNHPVARREAWIHAGRPLDAIVDDEWLDVETSIGIIVSMKPERARNARCRLQVLADRERATLARRHDAQLVNQWFADHADEIDNAPYGGDAEHPIDADAQACERARMRREVDRWLDVKRGEREVRDTLGY